MRRITLAFRVFGMSPTKMISRGERFAEIARDAFLQFGGERGVAVYVFLQNAKANQRFTFDRVWDANGGGFAHLRVRDEN
jgi:hypothetical protein